MKKNILLTIRILLFVIATGIILFGCYKVLKWKDTNGDYMSSIEQLYNSEPDSIDVAFLGSSHTFCGISPSYFWENYGIAAFDMSTSGQHKDATVHMLKELLKTQSPEVVVVDLYGLSIGYHSVLGNVYRNLLSMKTSINSTELILDYMNGTEEQLSNVPASKFEMLFKWPIVHSRYKELTSNDFGEYGPNKYIRGEVNIYNVECIDWLTYCPDVTESTAISDENRKWIDELIAISEEEGFELVFIVIPYNLGEEEQKQNNGAAEYIRENGFKCIDLNNYREEIGLDSYQDMCDNFHLNIYGAEKLCEYLAQNVLNEYDLEDHRGQSGYEAWEKDLLYKKHSEINNLLLTEMSGEEVSNLVGYTEGYSCILSLDGVLNESICEQYSGIFSPYGIKVSDMSYGGKWLVRNGETQLINANDPLTPAFYCDLSKRDTLKIEYTAKFASTNVMIGSESISSPFHFVSIAVYDEMLGEVVFKGAY